MISSNWSEQLKARLIEVLVSNGIEGAAVDRFAPVPAGEFGDVALKCFGLRVPDATTPADAAATIARLFSASADVEEARAAGPYVNVRFSPRALDGVLKASLEEERAHPGSIARRQTVDRSEILYEYANPNTHKEIHIGHLRNFVTGVAYHRLWKAAGVNVQAVQFVNDQGVNVAKTLWMLVTNADITVRSLNEALVEVVLQSWPTERQTGNELARIYVEATRIADERPEIAEEISFVQAQLEAHHPAWERLWRVTRDWCLRELHEICAELGVRFDRDIPYLESDSLDDSAKIVRELETSGVAKMSDGALIIDLEDQKLGVCLVRKSDGNLLYLSKDLALAYEKKRDYPGMMQSFVLTDNRQSLHFQQLNAVLQKMAYGIPYKHISYGLLTLKEGAMSSRKGNVVTYQDLRDALIVYAEGQTRERHPEWSDEQTRTTARTIAFGGMKFALLKQDPNTTFVFDREQALSFDGMTGPYCQYAVVRLESILKKAQATPAAEEVDAQPWDAAERELLLLAASLPKTIERAMGWKQGAAVLTETQPAMIAQWCFSLAQAINAFYRDTPVLDAAPALRARRLCLAEFAATALRQGLAILAIDVPKEM